MGIRMDVRSSCGVALACLALGACTPNTSSQQDQTAVATAASAAAARAEAATVSTETAANQAAAAGDPPAGKIVVPTGTLTKATFGQLVIGHSKAEVREAFGQPSNVVSMAGTDEWFYYSDRLPIRDADSGVLLNDIGVSFDASGTATSIES